MALRAKIAETTTPAPKPKMATTTVTKTEAPAAKPVKAEMKKPATEAKKPVAEVKKPAAMPVVAKIPAPFAQSKMERLNDLTARYLADKITPHDYHTERAKIIAEP